MLKKPCILQLILNAGMWKFHNIPSDTWCYTLTEIAEVAEVAKCSCCPGMFQFLPLKNTRNWISVHLREDEYCHVDPLLLEVLWLSAYTGCWRFHHRTPVTAGWVTLWFNNRLYQYIWPWADKLSTKFLLKDLSGKQLLCVQKVMGLNVGVDVWFTGAFLGHLWKSLSELWSSCTEHFFLQRACRSLERDWVCMGKSGTIKSILLPLNTSFHQVLVSSICWSSLLSMISKMISYRALWSITQTPFPLTLLCLSKNIFMSHPYF